MPPAPTPLLTESVTSAPLRAPGRAGRLSAPVAGLLLRRELPGLPAADVATVVGFVARRIDGLPSPLRLGVTLVAALFRLLLALPGGPGIVRALAERPLPLVGEYPRLVRSLGLAFAFETWPDRRADGSPPP